MNTCAFKHNDEVKVVAAGHFTNKVGVISCIINDPEEGTICVVKFSDTHRGMFPVSQLVLNTPFITCHRCERDAFDCICALTSDSEIDALKGIREEIALLSPEGRKKLERRGREAYNKLDTLRMLMVAYMINGGLIHKEDLC